MKTPREVNLSQRPLTTLFVAVLSAVCIGVQRQLAALRISSRAEPEPARRPLDFASALISGPTESMASRIAEITAIKPETGVSPQELLRVGASAASLCSRPAEQAIVRKAVELGIPTLSPDDFRYIREGIHCWIGNVPTLMGPRPFLVKMGLFIPSGEDQEPGKIEIFVAQGYRLLGALAISGIAQQPADSAP